MDTRKRRLKHLGHLPVARESGKKRKNGDNKGSITRRCEKGRHGLERKVAGREGGNRARRRIEQNCDVLPHHLYFVVQIIFFTSRFCLLPKILPRLSVVVFSFNSTLHAHPKENKENRSIPQQLTSHFFSPH